MADDRTQDLRRSPSHQGSEGGSSGSRKPAPVVKPAPSTMNPFLFPPRGLARPTLRQVLSEPNLRREFLGVDEDKTCKAAVAERSEYRQGMSALLHHLDVQCSQRNKDHHRRIETEVALIKTQELNQRIEQSGNMGFKRPEWSYTDPADYFEKPRPSIDTFPSATHTKNDLLMGMFDVPDEMYKPPHWEGNRDLGWNDFSHNEKNEQLYEFKTKEKVWPQVRMYPKEVLYAERLEKKLSKAKALEKQDALDKTEGSRRKKRLEDECPEFSALKKTKPAWTTQSVYTHTLFSDPDAYKAGDYNYLTGLPDHINQPDRAMSYELDVIVGDVDRKSFWKIPPRGAVKGTTVKANTAKALMCPRGCKEMQQSILRQSRSTGALPSKSANGMPLIRQSLQSGH